MKKQYLCIDLKSFFASVECVERNLDPMTANLVVADSTRTEKTICLAVTPALKSYGIGGRARLFEVNTRINEVNAARKYHAPGRKFTGESYDSAELKKNPALAVSFIIATPRMAYYRDYSTRIFDIYLKYIAREDILDYSIDEVFIDVTKYLKTYKTTARELAMTMIKDVYKTTGITATAGIGTNMYLAKIAMDIVAKKKDADEFGVRIAEIDDMSYRYELWTHRPLTDFWMIGKSTAKTLESMGLYTMGDVARCSLTDRGSERLYRAFGVNAELLIDHAWGWEPCTIEDAKNYRPKMTTSGAGQVLHEPTPFETTRLIVWEMLQALSADLVRKGEITDKIVLDVGYDRENLTRKEISYTGDVATDFYGRKVPKHAHGTVNLKKKTSSAKIITEAVLELFDGIVDERLLARRLNVTAVRYPQEMYDSDEPEQLDMFSDYKEKAKEKEAEEKEYRIMEAFVNIQDRYGKNAIIYGANLKKGGTAIERNGQIGGHKA